MSQQSSRPRPATRSRNGRRSIVAGRKTRAYRFGSMRIGFVLEGRNEYQLLCRLAAGRKDKDGACALLFESFELT